MALIEATGLGISRGTQEILRGIDFHVGAGEIVTVLGPNGSGKTTLIRALIGLEPLTAGQVTRQAGLRIGYVPQRFPLTSNVPLDVRRLLSLTLKPTESEIDEALNETGIPHLKDAAVARLSGGEMQRVLLARALLRKPELLVLDEPSSGLDPIVRKDILGAVMRTIADEGRTVLFSSHLLEEVEQVADHVTMIHHGRIVLSAPLSAISIVRPR